MYYCICFNTRNNIKKKITFLYSTQTWLFQEKKRKKLVTDPSSIFYPM